MKVFLMINPRLEDEFILKEAHTTYGVNKNTPMLQFLNEASIAQGPIMSHFFNKASIGLLRV